MMRRCAVSALARWDEYADERRTMRALVQRILGRLVNGETAKGFDSWRRACAGMRDAAGGVRARGRGRARLARRVAASHALSRQKAALDAAVRLFGDLQRRALAAWALHARGKRQRLVLARFGAKLPTRARAARCGRGPRPSRCGGGSARRSSAAARA